MMEKDFRMRTFKDGISVIGESFPGFWGVRWRGCGAAFMGLRVSFCSGWGAVPPLRSWACLLLSTVVCGGGRPWRCRWLGLACAWWGGLAGLRVGEVYFLCLVGKGVPAWGDVLEYRR